MATTADRGLDRTTFFIGNEWVRPEGGETRVALEAATEEPLGTVALGSPADIDKAVRAARAAFDEGPWGSTTASERAAVLRDFAAALRVRGEDTSELVSRENGMPIGLSRAFNGEAPAALVEMYAGMIESIDLESAQESPLGSTLVRREPVGVVGAICPWNYPQSIAIVKTAAALAAGCTVVLKPSPETALDSYLIAEAALEAGLPAGVLNVVVADREAAATLVTHPGVDKVTFTGSTVAGRWIGSECGRLMKRCTLELGGKSAAIFLDDGNVETLLGGLAMSSFMNNGQNCTAQMRMLVPRSRYDEVVEALVDYAEDFVVGDPLDPATTLGPMVSERQRERVLGYIDGARGGGARLVAGGGRPAGLDRGWFVEPTVFADVSNDDQIAREEVFGPVMAVIPYDGDDEAVALANDSEYGLAGSVWTEDEARGVEVARRVRTGTIGVNYYVPDLTAPFGGYKASGVGREFGRQGLESYLEWKAIYASAAQL
jgi:aldehyde dehydrogenase (NAD+)